MVPEISPVLDGKYRLLRKLGKGSMGSVYLGENTSIGRKVAVKVMNAELAEHHVLLDRFEREARAAARIRSPHVVEVLDLAQCQDGLRYMVMEHLEGETLGDRLDRVGALSLRDVSLLAMQLLEGVHAIHMAGIIHRDLKPDNVFLASNGDGEIVKVLDFGVSKLQFDPRDVTCNGTAVGTPNYMSPEQARGLPLDGRSDLFTIAVLLYEAATRHVPFVSSNVNDLLFKIALGQPTPIERWLPNVDPEFARIIRCGMARDPEQRYQSALEFQAAIAQWREQAFGVEAARGDLLEIACSISGDRWSVRKQRTASSANAASNAPPARSWYPRASTATRAKLPRVGWKSMAAPAVIALAMAAPLVLPARAHLASSPTERTPSAKVLAFAATDVQQSETAHVGTATAPLVAQAVAPKRAAARAKPEPRRVQVAAAVSDNAQSETQVNGYRSSPYDELPY